jgi:hypothetical protein
VNLGCSHLQLSEVHARRFCPRFCWIGPTGEMTKRRIPGVYEEVDTWTKKQGETTDELGRKSTKASSGRRVRADHAAARLVSSMSHAFTDPEYSNGRLGVERRSDTGIVEGVS